MDSAPYSGPGVNTAPPSPTKSNFGPGPTDQGYTPYRGPTSLAPTNSTSTPTGTPPASPGSPTSAPGVSATPYTAQQNLVNQQITPNADPQTLAYQQLTQAAANQLGAQDPTKLAQQEYNTFAQQTDPNYELALKQATDQAAAGGALGSGMLNTSLGNLANQRSLQLTGESQGLQENALQQTLNDQFAKAQTLGGLEGQSFGQGQTNLQDLMQQQGFQAGEQQQGIQNAAEEYQLEQAAQNQQFQQGLAEQNAGYAQNPANYQLAVGGQYGNEAQQSYANAGSLLGNYAEQQALAAAQGGNQAATQGALNLIGGQSGYIDPNTGLTVSGGPTSGYGGTDAGTGPGALPPTINPTYPGTVPGIDPTTGLPYQPPSGY